MEGFLEETDHDLVRRVFQWAGAGPTGCPAVSLQNLGSGPSSACSVVVLLGPTNALTLLGKRDFLGSPEATVDLVSPLSAGRAQLAAAPFPRATLSRRMAGELRACICLFL